MQFEISEERKENAFAVCFVPAPMFPDRKPVKDGVNRLVVVAANDDGGKWGFVALEKGEKEMIGDLLLKMEAPTDTWFWCQDFGRERVVTHPITGSKHTVFDR